MSEDIENNVNSEEPNSEANSPKRALTPTRIFIRGLAVSLPTILTIVILIWVLNFVNKYIIVPATWTVKYTMSQFVDQSVLSESLIQLETAPPLKYCGTGYLVTKDLREQYRKYVARQQAAIDRRITEETNPNEMDDYAARQQKRIAWLQDEADKIGTEIYVQLGPNAVPYDVYAEVARNLPPGQVPVSARAVYLEYVAHKYFRSLFHLSLLTVVLIIFVLYFTGQFVSARLGSWFVRVTEQQILGRLPLVRNIYGSAKQVTDFFFTENQPVEYGRVAAIQYPRKGVWSIGFVTGESMMQISIGAGEPCVTFLVPSSPAPMTGYTVNVPRREVLDLDITVEQAMQFCISCGVLSPGHQKMTPEKFKELVEQGLIRASISPQQTMQGAPMPTGQKWIAPAHPLDINVEDGDED
ncbi:DUF502 domain-containing protein [Thalassoglobus polymorphus]|uniref:DUF502 domain-containing protein n=1 Tax=Thalassoglobus polymorphus TaxID=2527994 RepID=A0A517QU30_9PLAN|nr:DUF502 domain-containing protein [Thalassoglobus polymorphus]QDT35057.1 hypothetical protein Mal48_43310 [Thalassoglobus polymorphus]